MDKEKEGKFDELHRIINITAKARYRASTRLSIHGVFSQWTLSLLTIGLIITSVLNLAEIELTFNNKAISVMEITFSVMILTYSLLLGMSNFTARSEKLHQCGLDMSRLVRKVKPLIKETKKSKKYYEISQEYYDNLEKYENHREVDFLSARLEIEQRKGYPDWKPEISPCENIEQIIKYTYSRSSMWTSIKIRYFISFSHYIFSVFIVYGWIFLIITDKKLY